MTALRLLQRAARLVLPVLVPSWRFFDSIGPSPRIEYQAWMAASPGIAFGSAGDAQPWTPWILTPATVGVGAMFAHLLFNASRNEALYLLACCERVVDEGSRHAEQQIAARLASHVKGERLAAHVKGERLAAHVKGERLAARVNEGRPAAHASDPSATARAVTCMRFRIVEVYRDGEQLHRQVAFESAVLGVDDPGPLA